LLQAPAKLFSLTSVRLLDGPVASAASANRAYMLDLDPDRLLAPFRTAETLMGAFGGNA
jgi:hypothetical protein